MYNIFILNNAIMLRYLSIKQKVWNDNLITNVVNRQRKDKNLTSIPVKPRAVIIFGVILNGTFSGTLKFLPFSKQTL